MFPLLLITHLDTTEGDCLELWCAYRTGALRAERVWTCVAHPTETEPLTFDLLARLARPDFIEGLSGILDGLGHDNHARLELASEEPPYADTEKPSGHYCLTDVEGKGSVAPLDSVNLRA